MRGLLKVGNAFLLGGALGTERRLQAILRAWAMENFRVQGRSSWPVTDYFSKSDVRIVSNTM
jgi:hypothetical protein